jgi:NAD(P)-dependent dehydrogenase (short-subunit alcohol dehydrogenase family)
MGLRILLTGATRGLGRAMAEGFAELAHTVVGCSRDAKAVAEMQSRLGSPHRFDVVDVADDAQVAKWAAAVGVREQPIDLVLNNAAVMNETRPLWEVSAEEMRKLVEINILGPANVVRHFVPPMVARGSGVIVNFSSGWGRSTSAEVAPYCATKYAIEGLTLALAQELPAGMAAVPLNPGIIDTDMLRMAFGADSAAYPDPNRWARKAVPYILGLGPKHNGQSLSVPS